MPTAWTLSPIPATEWPRPGAVGSPRSRWPTPGRGRSSTSSESALEPDWLLALHARRRRDLAQPRHPHQLGLLEGRAAVKPELHPVAQLYRRHRGVLAAPAEGGHQRVAGGDGRHLGYEDAYRAGAHGDHRQRPHTVEQHGPGLELRQRGGAAGPGEQPGDARSGGAAPPEP